MIIGDYLSQLILGISGQSSSLYLTWEQSVVLETLMMGGFTLSCCYFLKSLFKKMNRFPALEKRYRRLVLVQVSLLILLLYANIYAGRSKVLVRSTFN